MLESLFNKVADLKAYNFIKSDFIDIFFCMCDFLFCMEIDNAIQTTEQMWLFIEMEKEEKILVAYATFCFLWRHARQYRK